MKIPENQRLLAVAIKRLLRDRVAVTGSAAAVKAMASEVVQDALLNSGYEGDVEQGGYLVTMEFQDATEQVLVPFEPIRFYTHSEEIEVICYHFTKKKKRHAHAVTYGMSAFLNMLQKKCGA